MTFSHLWKVPHQLRHPEQAAANALSRCNFDAGPLDDAKYGCITPAMENQMTMKGHPTP